MMENKDIRFLLAWPFLTLIQSSEIVTMGMNHSFFRQAESIDPPRKLNYGTESTWDRPI